jgi:N4-gp56 family major capsid protein
MYSDNLSRELRTALQPGVMFRQLCDAKDAAHQGLGKGDTFHWNVYSDVTDDGTIGSTGISETEQMPEDNFTITQGTLTIGEFGRAVPYTGKLDDLSEQPVKEIIRKVLKNHAVKSIDYAAKAQFDTTPLRVVASSGTDTAAVTLTTNGTATATNNIALGKEHVKSIVDVMKERNIPAFGSGDYYAVGWPTTFRTLKNNLESIKQYVETGFAKIMNGEVGRYEGTRFIEQTNAAKGTGSTADAAWTNSKSDWAFFLGEDTVAEAIAVPEEIRGKIPTDFGRSRGVAWYALLGYGLVHTQAAQARILMWDSAA